MNNPSVEHRFTHGMTTNRAAVPRPNVRGWKETDSARPAGWKQVQRQPFARNAERNSRINQPRAALNSPVSRAYPKWVVPAAIVAVVVVLIGAAQIAGSDDDANEMSQAAGSDRSADISLEADSAAAEGCIGWYSAYERVSGGTMSTAGFLAELQDIQGSFGAAASGDSGYSTLHDAASEMRAFLKRTSLEALAEHYAYPLQAVPGIDVLNRGCPSVVEPGFVGD